MKRLFCFVIVLAVYSKKILAGFSKRIDKYNNTIGVYLNLGKGFAALVLDLNLLKLKIILLHFTT